MKPFSAIILAAGKGTRFQSETPKVLHPLHNKPMLHHVIHAVKKSKINPICLVVGYQHQQVKSSCKSFSVSYALQKEQLGTGHAVLCGLNTLQSFNTQHCVVLAGDCPLIQPETLQKLMHEHASTKACATVLTATLPDAGSYGRIIRNQSNQIIAIREAKDCTDSEKQIQEFNSGIYCFNIESLTKTIQKITTHNAQNEYYLTDVIESLKTQNKTVSDICISNAMEVSGANTPDELAELERASSALSLNE